MGKSWKSTLIGLLQLAGTVAFQAVSTSNGAPVNWQAVGLSVGVAALGYIAKDAGVTGTEK